jgi:hypothetical protein
VLTGSCAKCVSYNNLFVMPNCISLCSLIIMRASAALVVVVNVAVVVGLSLVCRVSFFLCDFPPLPYACTSDRELK